MAEVSKTVKLWFSKANNDLLGARSLWATQNPRVWLLVAFHCQQAAEKALKGFLLFKGKSFKQIHSIEELSKEVVPLVPQLADLLKQAATLTPYAIQFRYPSAAEKEVIGKDIEQALHLAAQMVSEFSSRIPFDASWGDI